MHQLLSKNYCVARYFRCVSVWPLHLVVFLGTYWSYPLDGARELALLNLRVWHGCPENALQMLKIVDSKLDCAVTKVNDEKNKVINASLPKVFGSNSAGNDIPDVSALPSAIMQPAQNTVNKIFIFPIQKIQNLRSRNNRIKLKVSKYDRSGNGKPAIRFHFIFRVQRNTSRNQVTHWFDKIPVNQVLFESCSFFFLFLVLHAMKPDFGKFYPMCCFQLF